MTIVRCGTGTQWKSVSLSTHHPSCMVHKWLFIYCGLELTFIHPHLWDSFPMVKISPSVIGGHLTLSKFSSSCTLHVRLPLPIIRNLTCKVPVRFLGTSSSPILSYPTWFSNKGPTRVPNLVPTSHGALVPKTALSLPYTFVVKCAAANEWDPRSSYASGGSGRQRKP
jgi:hypothetical protein